MNGKIYNAYKVQTFTRVLNIKQILEQEFALLYLDMFASNHTIILFLFCFGAHNQECNVWLLKELKLHGHAEFSVQK